MSQAVVYQIMKSVQKTLQDELTFEPQGSDSISTVPKENIVIRKLPFNVDSHKNDPSERMPGFLISFLRESRAPMAGTNLRDDGEAYIIIQLVDSDHDNRTLNLETYIKWMEQIARRFQSSAPNDVTSDDWTCTWTTHAVELNFYGNRPYKTHNNAVCSIELRFLTRQIRGVTGPQ